MTDWHHAPLHRFEQAGTYIVTAGTHLKQHIFTTPAALDLLQHTFFETAEKYGWLPQAWAFFPNHYHFVAAAGADARSLRRFITELHSRTAVEVNRLEGHAGRKVWFQYWDSQITYEGSYYARLKYVHENAVHHGVVERAADYAWCSARWVEGNAPSSVLRVLRSVRIDRVSVPEVT